MNEVKTFWQLINQHNIEIPIIQRDYAQGRKDNNIDGIRNGILDSLFNALSQDNPINLDIVYGDVPNNTLHPLDGQQRLTTLYLLHWYVACREEQLSGANKAILRRFTYETRISSREFCQKLVDNGIDFDTLLENSLSKTIKDKHWFFLSWESDPTISAMLNMLDAIHGKYQQVALQAGDIWNRLTGENPVITFDHIPLRDFGLSDDLYIKMNARGKQLTPFENFKASLEGHIRDMKWYTANLPTINNFAHRIDTIWTDLFWGYRDATKNTFDTQMANFFRVTAVNYYASTTGDNFNLVVPNNATVAKKEQYAKTRVDYFRNKESDADNISFNKFKTYGCITEGYIVFTAKVLDRLVDMAANPRTLKGYFTGAALGNIYFNEANYFASIINGTALDSMPNLTMIYAYQKYLSMANGDIDVDDANFIAWMRVIRNLVEAEKLARFDSEAQYAGCIRAIDGLLPYRNGILTYLATNNANIGGFSERIVNEEKLKAQLILRNDGWRNDIIAIENHGYFKGEIGFLLNFAGIANENNEAINAITGWTDEENNQFFASFNTYVAKVRAIFDSEGLNTEDFPNHIFERALLAKGDYLLTTSSNWSFLINTHRDISWKRLLRGDDTPYFYRNARRQYLKTLMDCLKENPVETITIELNGIEIDTFELDSIEVDDIKTNLQTIIDNFNDTSDWRYYFIKNPALFGGYTTANKFDRNLNDLQFLRRNGNYDILLLPSEKVSGFNLEYYSLALFIELRDSWQRIAPHNHIEYRPEKTGNSTKYFWIGEDANNCVEISYKHGVAQPYTILTVLNGDAVNTETLTYATREEVITHLQDNGYITQL
ncbi:MAG: DUF262 domain-containing protein [Chitinophagia bacterium]|nr:DUF262 domain-containing protein [Chitinophagia bacterium]